MNHPFDLSPLGLLCIQGEDAKKFLQGQLTCHLDEVTEHQSRLGAHCNPQGRIISFFRIFLYQNAYYLQMLRELIPIASKALQKYAVFFRVKLTDVSDQWQQIGLAGSPPAKFSQHDTLTIKLAETRDRYVILGPMEKNQLQPYSRWLIQDFAEKIPTIYPETSELFLPHELGLPALQAVSFNKGCYTGQEIIARMHYRGKLKTQLQQATVTSDLPPTRGSHLHPAGMIVDVQALNEKSYALLIISQSTSTSLFLDVDQHCSLEVTQE